MSVDRTPKPCHHKVADHQHGSRACYVLDACRCLPCAKANREAEQWRIRQHAYGRYDKFVDADPVREHLSALADYGIGLKRVAKLTGVSTGTLSKIVFGVYRNTGTGGGCKGPGERVREPSRRVLRTTAEKLCAVEAIPANLSDGAKLSFEDSRATHQRLQALVALGWSMSELGRRLGISWVQNAIPLIKGQRGTTAGTARKAEALFEELCMTLPPETNQRERISAARARNFAKAHGWVPPLALEDLGGGDIEGDLIDDAAIERRLEGERGVHLTKPERVEMARRALARGMSKAHVARLGIRWDDIKEASAA